MWCFYQLFELSFWQHPFTAEDPLLNKWGNATFLQIYSDEETNKQKKYILDVLRVSTFSHIFILALTIGKLSALSTTVALNND